MNHINHFFIKTQNYGKIHYAKSGVGQIPVVLTHGWGMSWRVWKKFLEHMDPEKYTVYAIDVTGFGNSDKPGIRYSIDNLAESLMEFIQALGINKPVIGGHSMGVTLCLEAVTRKELDVSGLIIADSGSRSGHRTSEIIKRLEVTTDKRSDLRSIVKTFFVHINDRDLDAFTTDAMKGTNESLIGSLQGISTFDYDPFLGSLSMPVVIFFGENDRNRNFDDVQHLHENIPGSELVVIGDAAHCPMYEQPWTFVSAFEKWASRNIHFGEE